MYLCLITVKIILLNIHNNNTSYKTLLLFSRYFLPIFEISSNFLLLYSANPNDFY